MFGMTFWLCLLNEADDRLVNGQRSRKRKRSDEEAAEAGVEVVDGRV